MNLGIDPRKSDQVVRGSTVMPNGIGKSVRVAVFAQGANADAARAAGADIVGFEDLAEKVKAGKMNFDVVIATPDAMRVVGQLGQILGPRGLTIENSTSDKLESEVARLVAQLDSNSRAERLEAEKALLAIGPDALDYLPPPAQLPTPATREAVRRLRIDLELRKVRSSVRGIPCDA